MWKKGQQLQLANILLNILKQKCLHVHMCVYKHIPAQKTKMKRHSHVFPSALSLTCPRKREEIFLYLLLERQQLAVTIAEFKTVNKEVMGFEPTVISSLALAITQDISR